MIGFNGVCIHEVTGGVVIPENATIESLALAGKYSSLRVEVNSKIFTIQRRGLRQLALVDFRRPMRGHEVGKEIQQLHGYSFATMEELLAFGALYDHPLLLQKYLIVCLGPYILQWNVPFAPAIHLKAGARYFRFLPDGPETMWEEGTQFLLTKLPSG